ncbi:Protein M3 [Nowakowskiella sp. JEL0078]|nr:Protein M3 [Nowakowskiella sp. JEL0078]
MVGYIVRKFSTPPPNFSNGIVLVTALGNVSDIAIAVLSSVVASNSIFGDNATQRATAYISIYNIPFILVMFVIGFKGIAQDFEYDKIGSESEVEVEIVEDTKMESGSNIIVAMSEIEDSSNVNASLVKSKISKKRMVRTFTHIKHTAAVLFDKSKRSRNTSLWLQATVYNPMNWSVAIGLIVSSVPVLRYLFLKNSNGSEPPLSFIFEAMQFVGAGAVPLGVINVGFVLGSLKVTSFKSMLKMSVIISVSRLVFMPLILLPIIYGVVIVAEVLPRDNILILILIFECCVPTAVSLIYFSQMFSKDGSCEAAGSVFVVMYPLSAITMSAGLIFALYLLQV